MKTLVVAHRAGFPENALSSAKRCLQLKVDMIEIDVRATKDMKIIVMHDSTLRRTTTGEGKIKNFTYKELSRFKLRNREKIPTLEEFIDLVKGKARLNIEVKEAGLEKELTRLLAKKGFVDGVIVSSFLHKPLIKIKQLNPRIKIGKITNTASSIFLPRNRICYSVHLKFSRVSKRFISKAAERFKIFFWTVNSEKDMKFLLDRKVEGIITDHPEKLIVLK